MLKKMVLLSSLLLLSACTDFVVGKNNPAEMKDHSKTWGLPILRPVVWGFTGIQRDCKPAECPQTRQ